MFGSKPVKVFDADAGVVNAPPSILNVYCGVPPFPVAKILPSLAPLQVISVGVRLTVGLGFTVTVTASVAVHPLFVLVVQVTEYVMLIGDVPVFVGVTVIDVVVALLAEALHNNVPPVQPVAVNCVDAPLQTSKSGTKLGI